MTTHTTTPTVNWRRYNTNNVMFSNSVLLLTTTTNMITTIIIMISISRPIVITSFSITNTHCRNRNSCVLSLSPLSPLSSSASSSSSSSRINYYSNRIDNQRCQLIIPSTVSKYATKIKKTTTTSITLSASVQGTISVDDNDNNNNNNNNNNNTNSIVDVDFTTTTTGSTTTTIMKKKNINFIQQYFSKFSGGGTSTTSTSSSSDSDTSTTNTNTNKITMKDKLAKAGLSAMLSYGWVSNISYAISVSLAWFIFNKRTGLSPLLKGQWKGFLSVYFGFYIFNNIIRPVRIGISIGISPIIDIIINKIQHQLNISKRFAIVVTVLLLNVIGTCTLMILGIILASILSGVPIFPIAAVSS